MDIISSVSTSVELLKRLREISKNIEEAEFKNLLADLSCELADIKLEVAGLKEKIVTL
jgi:phosphoribosylaminoimidazole-succinocarboxamide synthase